MFKKLLKNLKGGTILAILIFVAIIATIIGISWIGTCGIIYLITLCFGWEFSWGVSTGIWLVMILLSSVFKSNTTVKK